MFGRQEKPILWSTCSTRSEFIILLHLKPRQVAMAIEALRESYQEAHVSAHEPGTLRAHNLTARAEIFREIIQLPRLVACMAYLLGPDYILSDMGARSPLSGIAAQGLHRDGGVFVPNPPYNAHMVLPTAAQSMMALSPFTARSVWTAGIDGLLASRIEGVDLQPENYIYTPSRIRSIVATPDGKFVYAIDDALDVRRFVVDPTTGRPDEGRSPHLEGA